jgi:predicted aconitase with swiveling domain
MKIPAITLVPGIAEGQAFVMQEPLSFWGGLDAVTGGIIDRWHPQVGQILTGQVLVMKAGRGSSSGSSVLAEAIRLGTGPSGIVLLSRDAIVTVGAMIASELYGRSCPVALAEASHWPLLAGAAHLDLFARPDKAEIGIVA